MTQKMTKNHLEKNVETFTVIEIKVAHL